jgi:hypothetical protein
MVNIEILVENRMGQSIYFPTTIDLFSSKYGRAIVKLNCKHVLEGVVRVRTGHSELIPVCFMEQPGSRL